MWERATDRLMRRTQMRPMADMRLTVAQGTTFGMLLTIVGATEPSAILTDREGTSVATQAEGMVLSTPPTMGELA